MFPVPEASGFPSPILSWPSCQFGFSVRVGTSSSDQGQGGLLAAERTHAVPPHSTGSRVAAPDQQRNSGLHMQGTSNPAVNICHFCFRNVMLRWHCNRIGNVVIICQPVCKNCAPLHTSWQLVNRGCLHNVTGVLESWFCGLHPQTLMFQRQVQL